MRRNFADIVQESERIKERLRAKEKRIDYSVLAIPKSTELADGKFRRWANRTHDCRIRGKQDHRCFKDESGKVVKNFCHVPTGGHRALSKKAGDIGGGIVMCLSAHQEQHQIGWPAFEVKYGIDARREARILADEYGNLRTERI